MKCLFLFLAAAIALQAAPKEFTPDLRRTSHTYSAAGKPLNYTAVAGELPLSDEQGNDLAELFFIAYLVEEAPERPITFVFPGGPGGSCAWEVMCTFGPRRLETPDEGKPILPPYKIIDNPESLLPWTDLVFVDPVTTGYSKFAEEVEDDDKKSFFSTDGDIASLGDFIYAFLSYFKKWNCPKYLAGISYGTVRCCGIANYLAGYDCTLHGVILMGSALDYSTLLAPRNHPLPESLLIPTFAATAWYHGRFWPDASLEQVADYARRFVYDDYIPFMLQPTRLSRKEQDVFYKNLSELIGLQEQTVRRYLGRFDETLYTTEFMANERKIIGGLDTRYTGDLSAISRFSIDEDPSYKDMHGVFCAFNAYLQKELELSRPFELYATFMSSRRWNFWTYDSVSWPDVLQRLRRMLVWNPSMKVFSGSGYYDCRTPFAATEYCFEHLDLPDSYRNNLQFEYYEAGHGFIFDHPSLKKLKIDLVKFYEK